MTINYQVTLKTLQMTSLSKGRFLMKFWYFKTQYLRMNLTGQDTQLGL